MGSDNNGNDSAASVPFRGLKGKQPPCRIASKWVKQASEKLKVSKQQATPWTRHFFESRFVGEFTIRLSWLKLSLILSVGHEAVTTPNKATGVSTTSKHQLHPTHVTRCRKHDIKAHC